jgi:VCBS repeat protein
MMSLQFRIAFSTIAIFLADAITPASAQSPALSPGATYAAHLADIVVADLQGDNAPDIVGFDTNSNSLGVMLNHGDGTYGSPHIYGLDRQANGLAVGDFNGDGKLDVAAALSGSSDTSGRVAVLLNVGHGQLGSPHYYIMPVPVNSIAVGDFNHDGKADIAVIGNRQNNAVNTVVILTNTGSSFSQKSMTAPVRFGTDFEQPQADYVDGIIAGDFNGDNRIDLAYLDRCAVCDVPEDQIVLLVNTATGWQAKVLNGLFESGAIVLTAADVDGDGRADILAPFDGCHTPCQGVDVFYMDKDLVSPAAAALPLGNFGFDPLIRQVIVGDINNDGVADIAGYGENGSDINYNPLRPGIVAWTATGKRTFGQPKYFEQASEGPGFVGGFTAAGFVDKDAKRDLIVPWGEDLQVWRNITSNTKDPCSYPTSGGIHVCAPASEVASGNVRFLASARTNTQPLQRLELWIDGKRRWVLYSDRMDLKLSVPNGTHSARFVEVGASGLSISKNVSFAVGN